MNSIKRYAGFLWMLLAPAITGLLIWQAADKVNKAAPAIRSNVMLQWGIILFIFIPICTGLFVFGWYAVKGYYNRLPESSAALEEE